VFGFEGCAVAVVPEFPVVCVLLVPNIPLPNIDEGTFVVVGDWICSTVGFLEVPEDSP
jgi:hypothetical protein